MFQESIYRNRVSKLQQKLEPHTLYLFSNPSHLTYFTGFQFLVPNEREAFFACTKNSAALIHTSFAPLSEFTYLEFLAGAFPSQLKNHIEKLLQKNGIKLILFDPATLFVAELQILSEIGNITTKPMLASIVGDLVMQKDEFEIAEIKQACKITARVLSQTQKTLQLGMSEIAVADFIAEELKKNGSKELAFPTIVAFGSNSALPHHQPSAKQLEANTAVLIDMGAKSNNYCADMTRTIWFGDNPNSLFQKISQIVESAHSQALTTLEQHTQKSIQAKDVDNAARTHIMNQGFGEHFIHTTGHGLGLDIHEPPSLSWRNFDPISPNMTLTIEPGVYLIDEFGYRHEDTVLTTTDGYELLTAGI